jgi:hypothetical protein
MERIYYTAVVTLRHMTVNKQLSRFQYSLRSLMQAILFIDRLINGSTTSRYKSRVQE